MSVAQYGGAAAGAAGGAEMGAALGTAIFPGIGTVVGGIAGGLYGAYSGYQAGSAVAAGGGSSDGTFHHGPGSLRYHREQLEALHRAGIASGAVAWQEKYGVHPSNGYAYVDPMLFQQAIASVAAGHGLPLPGSAIPNTYGTLAAVPSSSSTTLLLGAAALFLVLRK